ncbi:uncharacterized protein LOC135494148 [Lineus longissimus]|uniref:uncharacterized protein LOC135494148 n=1 Tax=Lineus longissimus TaxID=88925 RepID=UPI00315D7363
MFGTPLELSGYYVGLILGMSIVVCVFCFLIWYINWEKEVAKARIRTGTDQIAMEILGPAPELTHSERTNSIVSRRSSIRGRTCSISSEWYEDYMGNYGSQHNLISDPSESTHKKLDKKTIKLIATRVLFVLFMVLTFVIGLVFRISEAPGHDSANSTTISTMDTSTLAPFIINSTSTLYNLSTSWSMDSTT